MQFLHEPQLCLKQVGRSARAPGQAVPGSNSGDKVAIAQDGERLQSPWHVAQVPSGSAACWECPWHLLPCSVNLLTRGGRRGWPRCRGH